MQNNKEHFPFIVTIFPADQSKMALAKLFSRIAKDLEEATGNKPHIVRPNTTAAVILIEGDSVQISSKLRDACDNSTPWLIARIELPFSTFGLAASDGWLGSALRRQLEKSPR